MPDRSRCGSRIHPPFWNNMTKAPSLLERCTSGEGRWEREEGGKCWRLCVLGCGLHHSDHTNRA